MRIMTIRCCVLLSVTSFFPFFNLYSGWLDRKAEGWFWYEDRMKKEKEDVELDLSECPQAIPPSPALTATEQMTAIRQELDERLHQAILEPNEENVLAYMQMQQKWMNQSSQFSQVWVRNVLNHPHLDSRLNSAPVTQYGVQIQKQILREQREETIHRLAKSHGLFFFYEGKNKVSQAFSFVVKEFAKKYDWQIVAISCDGFLIPDFDNTQANQGITQRLNIETFPSLFLVEPHQQKIIPIAFGLSSIDQIEENILLQLQALRSQP